MAGKSPTFESELRALYTFPSEPGKDATADEIDKYNKLVEGVQSRIDTLSSDRLGPEATEDTKHVLIGGKKKRA